MDASNAYRVRIIGDEAVAHELSAYAAAHPDEMHVVSSERDEDPTRLGYTLTEVVAVVLTVAKTIVSSAQLAKKLSEWLQKSKGYAHETGHEDRPEQCSLGRPGSRRSGDPGVDLTWARASARA
jgi:hypothetical protein